MKNLILSLISLCIVSSLFSQEERNPEENLNHIRVFLDCRQCDLAYFSQELSIIDYVRNRDDADVHVFVTTNRTSSQRIKFEVKMIGRNGFEGQSFDLHKYTEVEPTTDDIRVSLLEIIKLGLVPYLGQTNLSEAIRVNIKNLAPEEKESVEDPWNFWVFELNGNGSWNKETSQTRLRYSASMSAERVTEMWRIRSNFYGNGNSFQFINDGESLSTSQNSKRAYVSVVRSLGAHLSAGISTSYNSSTFSNIARSVSIRPALEYNFFPYSEVSRRELTIAYRVGPNFRSYEEITIYDQLSEDLWRSSLSMNLRMRQPWGNIFAGLTGSHFFHDFSKNRVELDLNTNLRIYKGLNLRLGGAFELIRDQLSLAKGDASLEDILLRQKQVAKGFESSMYVGVSYTFGSIFNNVVNTRL